MNEFNTFREIKDREDPEGTNHDLRLICVKCGDVQTCRCSKPKREFKGICSNCSENSEMAEKESKSTKKIRLSRRQWELIGKTAGWNTLI